MSKTTERKIDCKYIDINSLADLRLALITARDTYNDMASRLIGIGMELHIPSIQKQARKFHVLLYELDKIPPC